MSDVNVIAYGKDFSYLDELAKDEKQKYCIYGCGVNGEIICQYLLTHNKEIEFFVDRQAETREFLVLNKSVISLDTFLKTKSDIKIIISPDNQEPIVRDLVKKGINQLDIVCPFRKIEHMQKRMLV